MKIALKRVYDSASRSDGTRVLVDRLWPRGLTKEAVALDEWMRDLAPSNELRKWFHSHGDRWNEFRQRYLKELGGPEAEEQLRKLYALAHKKKRLTLLFGSRNEARNNATVLKELLEGLRRPPTGTGPGILQGMKRRNTAQRRR